MKSTQEHAVTNKETAATSEMEAVALKEKSCLTERVYITVLGTVFFLFF